jgi:hypothetical protein
MNAERRGWAIAELFPGYIGILFLGACEWLVMGTQGISPFGITYLNLSFMLVAGVMLSLFFCGPKQQQGNTNPLVAWGALAIVHAAPSECADHSSGIGRLCSGRGWHYLEEMREDST